MSHLLRAALRIAPLTVLSAFRSMVVDLRCPDVPRQERWRCWTRQERDECANRVLERIAAGITPTYPPEHLICLQSSRATGSLDRHGLEQFHAWHAPTKRKITLSKSKGQKFSWPPNVRTRKPIETHPNTHYKLTPSNPPKPSTTRTPPHPPPSQAHQSSSPYPPRQHCPWPGAHRSRKPTRTRRRTRPPSRRWRARW